MKLHNREFITMGRKDYIRTKFQRSIHRNAETISFIYPFHELLADENLSNRREYFKCIDDMADKFATEKYWYEIDKDHFNADTGWYLIRLVRREPEPNPNGGQS